MAASGLPLSCITGPLLQLPGAAWCPGEYRAVWAVPPIANTRWSGSRIAGPISNMTGLMRLSGVFPALTQMSSSGR